MSETATIAILGVAIFESLMIFIGNTFTVFVFWLHRHKLNIKRTSFLLINLAVADLLVGITEIVAVGLFALPRRIGGHRDSKTLRGHIFTPFQAAFSGTSIFFLVLISLERAFALIWPLRHRVTSTKTYIYSAVTVWLVGVTVGVLALLAVLDLFDFFYYTVSYSVIIVLSLIVICMSYLSIRTRLNQKHPAINMAHNRQSVQQSTKLSNTLFIVIGASVVLWLPSLAFYCTKHFSPGLFSKFVSVIFTMLHLTNSLVNPIIYSLRMPVFKEALKRVKNKLRIRKQSKKYAVNDCRKNASDV